MFLKPQWQSNKKKSTLLLIGLAIYALALFLRTFGITDSVAHVDEFLWRSRSGHVARNLRLGNFSNFSTHLSHPGLPPSLIMGTGQLTGRLYNRVFNFDENSPNYLDDLASSRIAGAFASSLLPPLVFLGCLSFIGFLPSLTASFLIALDAHHVYLSRLAHLDSMLTLFVFITSICFAKAQFSENKKERLKFHYLSAFFWGLAIATKPTAMFLVIAFFLFKILQFVMTPKSTRSISSLLTWHDVWAIVIGQLVLISGYTRLWHHLSRERYLLNVNNSVKTGIHNLANWLNTQQTLSLLFLGILIVVTTFSFLRFHKKSENLSTKLSFHIFNISLLTAIFFGFLFFGHQIVENVFGFWCWVAGLNSEKHYTFNHLWPAIGYTQILFRKLPSLISIGLIISIGLMPILYFKNRKLFEFSLFLLCIVFVWLGFLSTSNKQGYRYAMPAIPFIYIIVTANIFGALALIKQRKTITALMFAVLVIPNIVTVFNYFPDKYDVFFSKISGGIISAKNSSYVLPLGGEKEALSFLHNKALEDGAPIKVAVIGEPKIFKDLYSRIYSDLPGGKLLLDFSAWPPNLHGYYSLATHSLLESAYPAHKEHLSNHLVYAYPNREFSLIQVAEPEFLNKGESLSYSFRKTFRFTGQTFEIAENKKDDEKKIYGIEAIPGRDPENYIFFGENARFKKGTYEVTLEVETPKDGDLNEKILDLELTGLCKNSNFQDTPTGIKVLLHCKVDKTSQSEIRAYWYGKTKIKIWGLKVARID